MSYKTNSPVRRWKTVNRWLSLYTDDKGKDWHVYDPRIANKTAKTPIVKTWSNMKEVANLYLHMGARIAREIDKYQEES